MFRTVVVAAAALSLGACASKPVAIAIVPPPVVRTIPVAPPPPPPLSAMNANLSPAATTWHVRAALNVAALACRNADEAVIVANYNAMLKAQQAGLTAAEAALAAEFKAAGGDWRDRYDDAMTRLYNFFSQNGGRDAFCHAAAAALADAQAVTPDGFTAFAAARLAALDAPFAVAAPRPAAPATQVAAAATPRLALDLSGLN